MRRATRQFASQTPRSARRKLLRETPKNNLERGNIFRLRIKTPETCENVVRKNRLIVVWSLQLKRERENALLCRSFGIALKDGQVSLQK